MCKTLANRVSPTGSYGIHTFQQLKHCLLNLSLGGWYFFQHSLRAEYRFQNTENATSSSGTDVNEQFSPVKSSNF